MKTRAKSDRELRLEAALRTLRRAVRTDSRVTEALEYADEVLNEGRQP